MAQADVPLKWYDSKDLSPNKPQVLQQVRNTRKINISHSNIHHQSETVGTFKHSSHLFHKNETAPKRLKNVENRMRYRFEKSKKICLSMVCDVRLWTDRDTRD